MDAGKLGEDLLSVNDKNQTRRNALLSGVAALVLLRSLSIGAAAAPTSAPTMRSAPAVSNPGKVPSILPGDADLQRIVDDRVVTYHDSVGLIVGVVEPSGRRLFARGPAKVGNDDSVDGDTIFEIGSVSKVFTALALADEAPRGELSLSDPAAKYLPPGTKLPQRGPRPISLLDLGTHMSGLPKMPANVAITNFNDPNADMTANQFLQSVAAYELTRDVGSAYEYSNAGYDLLGIAVTNAGHTDFETLLKSRIFGPLHMENTRIASSLEEKDRLSAGYDAHLEPVPHARAPTLLGSDGVRSTANDLLNFIAANIGLTNLPLAPAMADMVKFQRPTQYSELKAALGWHVATLHGIEMIWENGQTAGYRAFIGFVPKSKVGVVVLSNSVNAIDDIGVHILDKDTPLRNLHREVAVKPSDFDGYIGRYEVSETFFLNITSDANRLYIQGTGQPRAELYSEGDGKFFLRVVDGEVIFQTDSGGRARSLSLIQGGKRVTALLTQ
ncbi:MAG: ampH [Rhodospirillales bacterium]|nr:ampH [Rhodospirillales bacterium]